MAGFLGLLGIVLLAIVTIMAMEFASHWQTKVAIASTGAVVVGLLVVLLLSAAPKEEGEAKASPAPTATQGPSRRTEPDSVTVNLQNYRSKGDNIQLECSGPTGNIKCKPVR